MNKGIQKSLENSCKNCSHSMSLHKPNCLFKLEDNHGNFCSCKDAQYYNTIVSDKYIGWVEIHCNSCGNILGFIDSAVENVYDFTTLCPNCISKVVHPH
jgi:hypothetical protein